MKGQTDKQQGKGRRRHRDLPNRDQITSYRTNGERIGQYRDNKQYIGSSIYRRFRPEPKQAKYRRYNKGGKHGKQTQYNKQGQRQGQANII